MTEWLRKTNLYVHGYFFLGELGGGGGVSDRQVQLQEHCGTKRKRVRVAVIRSQGHK